MKFSIFKFLGLTSLLSVHGVSATSRRTALTFGTTTTLSKKEGGRASIDPALSAEETSNSIANTKTAAIRSRGGACSDSDPVLFLKIGISTVAEAAALFGIIWASIVLAGNTALYPTWIPDVFGEPLVNLLASMLVIFGSSFVGGLLEGGMSAASKQALMPTKVLGAPNWYNNLVKPSWNPPGWVFPIMWLIVSKPTQLCAISRIIKFGISDSANRSASWVALAIYTTHLALGDAWNKVFFGLECIGRGTFVITLFFGALLASTYHIYNIDKLAGYYMLPTCGWVAVASALQYSIYFKNKKK